MSKKILIFAENTYRAYDCKKTLQISQILASLKQNVYFN